MDTINEWKPMLLDSTEVPFSPGFVLSSEEVATIGNWCSIAKSRNSVVHMTSERTRVLASVEVVVVSVDVLQATLGHGDSDQGKDSSKSKDLPRNKNVLLVSNINQCVLTILAIFVCLNQTILASDVDIDLYTYLAGD